MTIERLLETAICFPKGHEETKQALIEWIEETRIPDGYTGPSIEYVDVAIMHSVMKYRLGFLSKIEVLDELRQSGEALSSDPADTTVIHQRLSRLLYSIEDDTPLSLSTPVKVRFFPGVFDIISINEV